jgi:hypothetical protein
MDKFGIFKLLNSFLNFLGQKQSSSTPDFSTQNTSDVVSNLLKSLGTNNSQNQQPATNENKMEKSTARPLQADMLKTMNSHDEFIRRVKQKNP